MKKVRIFLILVVLVIILFLLTGCSEENKNTTNNVKSANTNTTTTNKESEESMMTKLKKLTSEDVLVNAEKQMAEPAEGDTIAIFHIEGYGDVKIKFFEEVAPKACENFITHAKEGYYNGVTFHRVINEFMIQGGDPEGTGMGGESIWGKDFGEELDASILPYRGSLCMASRGTGTTSLGSQFFIVQASYNSAMSNYISAYGYKNLLESYKTYGGDLYDLAIYAQYTTFGQVIEGMDIVDKIAAVEANANDKPLTDVVISSIEITTYSK